MLSLSADGQTPPRLSGAFDVSLLYDASVGSPQLEGEAAVDLTLATWKASAELGFDEGVWDELTFEAVWSEEPVEIESTVRFEPDKDRFRDWKTEVAWTFDVVDLKLTHNLTRTRNWLTLEADWASDPLEVDTRVRLRSTECAPLVFYDAEVEAKFSLCGSDTSIGVEFDSDGFDALALTVEELVVDRLSWLSLDLEAERTLSETTIEIDPSIELGAAACLTFEAEATGGTGLVGDLRVVEAALECDFSRVEIEATVYLDPDDWVEDRYAATLTLETEGSLAPERAIETQTTLFWNGLAGANLARIASSVNLELTDRISVWLELDVDVELTGLSSISVGIDLEW